VLCAAVWKTASECSECDGEKETAMSVVVNGRNITKMSRMRKKWTSHYLPGMKEV
jgi:excinuclease UvrABC ATPase subunit